MAAVTLRPYQSVGIEGVRSAFGSGKRNPLFVMGCGGGKTICFSYITQNAASKGKRVLIVAHRRELIKQASRKLSDAGVQHGIISPGFTPTRDPVQVASIQTIDRRLDKIGDFDLIVIDEAHHSVAGQYVRLIASQPKAKLLGVTATPERLDGLGLGIQSGGCFDDLILGPQPHELIEGGWLKPFRVFAPATMPDLSGIKKRMGDDDTASLAEALNKPTLTGCAIDHYSRLTPGKPAVVFCVNVKHAQDEAAGFRAAGWRAVAADGSMSQEDRDAAIGGLATGAVQVLTVCDLVSEGLDIPGISVIILRRRTQSLTNFIQWAGRGNRPVYAPGFDLSTVEGRKAAIAASDQPYCTILDHVGCTAIHGMPDAEREWSLAGRPKKEKAPPTRQCPVCFCIHVPSPVCPECGHSYAEEKSPGSALEQTAGELVEFVNPLTPAWANGLNLKTAQGPDFGELLDLADTKEKITEIAKARKYHRGWVNRVWSGRQVARLGVVA